MHYLLRSVWDWLKSISGIITLFFFVGGCAVSLYPQQIKRLLHEWPRTRSLVRKFRYNTAKGKLDELVYLHGDSYRLNLHVYYALVGLFVNAVCINFFFAAATVFTSHKWPEKSTFGSIFIGMLFGKALNLQRVFADLAGFEDARRRLAVEMARNKDGANDVENKSLVKPQL